jgi:hypothetical protein
MCCVAATLVTEETSFLMCPNTTSCMAFLAALLLSARSRNASLYLKRSNLMCKRRKLIQASHDVSQEVRVTTVFSLPFLPVFSLSVTCGLSLPPSLCFSLSSLSLSVCVSLSLSLSLFLLMLFSKAFVQNYSTF